jgi:hypothetical protein
VATITGSGLILSDETLSVKAAFLMLVHVSNHMSGAFAHAGERPGGRPKLTAASADNILSA